MRIGAIPYNTSQTKPTAEAAEAAETAEATTETDEVLAKSDAPKNPQASAKAANIEALLRAFEMPDTPENREILRNMLSGGLSATKENFSALSQVLQRFEGLTAQQAVFMVREQIPINPQNISQFQEFLQHRNLVGSQLENIMNILAGDDATTPPQVQQPTQQLQSQTTAVLPQTPQAEQQPSVQPQQSQPTQQTLQQAPTVQQPQAGIPQTSQLPINDNIQLTPTLQDIPDGAEPTVKPQSQTQSQVQPQVQANAEPPAQPQLTQPAQNMPHSQAAQTAQPMQSEPTLQNTQNAQMAPNAPTAQQPHPPPTSMPLNTPENTAALSNTVNAEQTNPPPEAVKTGDAKVALDNNTSIKPQQTEVPDEAAQPEKLDKLIASLFKKVDPERAHRLPREMNAQALVKELNEVIDAVKQRMPEMTEERRTVLTREIAGLERNVEFLNKLSQFTPVVNIPLQWGNERTTAELYVFNDSKGGKKIDPQNATVFLSLMTANAGRVETMIKVLGKNVECDFSLETPETVNIVQGNMPRLNELLDSQGYRLARSSALPAEKARDIFDVKEVRDTQKAKYFFDRTV